MGRTPAKLASIVVPVTGALIALAPSLALAEPVGDGPGTGPASVVFQAMVFGAAGVLLIGTLAVGATVVFVARAVFRRVLT